MFSFVGNSTALLDLTGLDTSPSAPTFPEFPTQPTPSHELSISLLDDELMSLGKGGRRVTFHISYTNKVLDETLLLDIILKKRTKEVNTGHRMSSHISIYQHKRYCLWWSSISLTCGGWFVVGLTDNTPSSTLASSQSGDASTWNSFQVRKRNYETAFRVLLGCNIWLFFPPSNYTLVWSVLGFRYCRHTRPSSTSRRAVAISYYPPGPCWHPHPCCQGPGWTGCAGEDPATAVTAPWEPAGQMVQSRQNVKKFI